MCSMCKYYKHVGNSATRHSARDARLLQDDGPRPQRRHKNTRRWCKGIEGREHVLEVKELVQYGRRARFADVCQNCGKHLNEFWCWVMPRPEWARSKFWN